MPDNQKLKIAFFGTSEFASIILQKLITSPYKPSLVITQPDKPAGRKRKITFPPAKILAQRHNILVEQPLNLDSSSLDAPDSEPYALFIVAAYGQIIPKGILEMPKYGTLNVHPSLLPRWRGPSPIHYTLLNGDKRTGVTIILIDEDADHGPIIAAEELQRDISNMKYPELHDMLADLGSVLLIRVIPDWILGKLKTIEQDHEKATYSKKIKKGNGHINWSESALQIERMIRAFTPWPGSFTFFGNLRIKILTGHANNSSLKFRPEEAGKILSNGVGIVVQTGSGGFTIEKIQPESKQNMSAKEILNGYPRIIGAKLN